VNEGATFFFTLPSGGKAGDHERAG
jgi:hypothetical protein